MGLEDLETVTEKFLGLALTNSGGTVDELVLEFLKPQEDPRQHSVLVTVAKMVRMTLRVDGVKSQALGHLPHDQTVEKTDQSSC